MIIPVELKKATQYYRSGRLEKADRIYKAVLTRMPNHPDALHLRGLIANRRGDRKKARELIGAAIGINPHHSTYYNNLGAVSRSDGEMEAAVTCYRKAISLEPEYADAWYNLGTVYHTTGTLDEAVSCYKRAIHCHPQYIDALNNLAAALNEMGKFEASIACCRRVIAMNANHAAAYNNLGNALKETEQLPEASNCYQKAIALLPDQCEFYNNLANVHMDMGNIMLAVEFYRQAVDLNPDFAQAYNGMGTAMKALGNQEAALSCFEKTVRIQPNDFQGYHNMGNTYLEMSDFPKALACYTRAVDINPDHPEPYLNMGFAYRDLTCPEEEYQSYKKALQVNPGHEKAVSHMVHYLMQACDWQSLERFNDQLDRMTWAALETGKKAEEMPFLNLARTDDIELNYRLARSWSSEIEKQCAPLRIIRPTTESICGISRSSRQRITIGYLSNNFKNHPTAHLTAGIFRAHDRDRFKVHCYSYGEDDRSTYRKKIQSTCDHFSDLQNMDHLTAARKIADDKVDILIDLVGYMKGHRLQIPAFRPAAIQVRWLGMAGTTGAHFFDYILTHPIVTPEHHASCYSEAFAYLPDGYQVNDRDQKISEARITRSEMQLPPDTFVFCCFCTHYKIDPVIFKAWMNILKRIPDSVLWLLKGKGKVMENLKNAAQSHGIDGSRLIFAEKISKARHLKRLQLADLALDTTAVNGAATTSDALWAGIPVITKTGKHFASSMSACILSAVGMSELVVRDLAGYEMLALKLASQPNLLGITKDKLNHNRFTQALFNTPHFVAHLESAYRMMWDRYLEGECPNRFYVSKR